MEKGSTFIENIICSRYLDLLSSYYSSHLHLIEHSQKQQVTSIIAMGSSEI